MKFIYQMYITMYLADYNWDKQHWYGDVYYVPYPSYQWTPPLVLNSSNFHGLQIMARPISAGKQGQSSSCRSELIQRTYNWFGIRLKDPWRSPNQFICIQIIEKVFLWGGRDDISDPRMFPAICWTSGRVRFPPNQKTRVQPGINEFHLFWHVAYRILLIIFKRVKIWNQIHGKGVLERWWQLSQ